MIQSLTKEEKARILQALQEDSDFREEVRRLLLEEVQTRMQELQEIIQRTHAVLNDLAVLVREGFEAVHQDIRALTQQMQENSRQILENSRQIGYLAERTDALTQEVREIRIRLDDVSGVSAEAGAKDEIGIWLRSRNAEIVRAYLPGDLQDHLGGAVREPPVPVPPVPVPDGVMLLRSDSGYVFLVYEITFTVALRDVRRVAEWLAGFRRVGWPAIGLVHYRRTLPEEDETRYIQENGREVVQTVPGMRTLREEATRGEVLLMQHGAAPWRPEGWLPPKGLAELPPVLLSLSDGL